MGQLHTLYTTGNGAIEELKRQYLLCDPGDVGINSCGLALELVAMDPQGLEFPLHLSKS